MSEPIWNQTDSTLSHKNASKEFELSEQQIFDAMKQGKLQYRQNVAHGNPYFRLLRAEVELLALEIHGSQEAVQTIALRQQLKKITSEITSHKRKVTALEKQKAALAEQLKQLQNAHLAREGDASATEIFPSSFRCSCGKQLDFFEGTIKEIKKMSQKRPQRLGGENDHTILFHTGMAKEIQCPTLGKCPITGCEH